MKVKLFQCAIVVGVGLAIGCTIRMQPATAACFSTQVCSSDACCRGSARSSGTVATTGVKSAPAGPDGVRPSCGVLFAPNPATGALCTDEDAINTGRACGGFAAVKCP